MKRLAFLFILGVILMTGCAKPANDAGSDAETTANTNANNPQVTVEMEGGGTFIIELYPDKAPNTVNNFLSLAGSGYYDGVIFHRVIAGLIIQGGDPEGTGMGGPGYNIKGEMSNNGYKANDLKHVRGVISMARRGGDYDSAGSQFFIMGTEYQSWDGEYTAFGMVIDGMDTVDGVMSTRVDGNDRPRREQKISKMTVETFGETYPEPDVIR